MVAAAVVVVLSAAAAAFGGAVPTILRLDWHSGTNDAFSTPECPRPEEHFKIVGNPTRTGKPVARFTIDQNDRWVDGVVRCLDANYTTDEGAGQTYFFGFSLYVPRPGLQDNLIWELHQPKSL